jgi:hypothetical protein
VARRSPAPITDLLAGRLALAGPPGGNAMSDRSLLLLLDEVRGKTLRLLQDVSDHDARWTPPGLSNHVLWHGGHAFVLVEWLTMHAVGDLPHIPHQWMEMFGGESHPATIADNEWPAVSRVVEELKRQHGRVRHLLGELSEEKLASPTPKNPHHTIRYAILHALHDEACHGGEIWMLRKMLKAQK